MMAELHGVDAALYAANVAVFAPEFARLERSSGGKMTVGSLDREIRDGRKQLWAITSDHAICGIAITEVANYPNGEKWARVLGYAGENMDHCAEIMREFKEVSKAMGFVGVELFARPGWARVLKGDFDEGHRIMEARF